MFFIQKNKLNIDKYKKDLIDTSHIIQMCLD